LATAAISLLIGLVLPTVSAGATTSPNGAQVRARLLTVAEMPAGWSVDTAAPSSGATIFPCIGSLTLPKHDHFVSATIQFQSGPVPVFSEKLTTDGSPMAAVFRSGVRALDRCKTVTLSGLHASIEKLAFPTLGNASAAFAAIFTYKATPAGLDLVIFRSGIYEGLLVYVDAGTPAVSAVEALAELAVAKVKGEPIPARIAVPTT
jgi:hypothetical protein